MRDKENNKSNKSILVYNDLGVSDYSTREMYEFMREMYKEPQHEARVEYISAKDIVDGRLGSVSDASETILCMGGGYDLGFIKALGAAGCARIVEFVRDAGGCYFGACAGAYFACESIVFDADGPLEVKGPRQLGFYRGRAIGPVNRHFAYNSHERAFPVRTRLSVFAESSPDFRLYLNGGFYFESSSSRVAAGVEPINRNYKCRILAYYADAVTANNIDECLSTAAPNDVAIVATRVDRGRCLLSAVHFEFDAKRLSAALDADKITSERLCQPMLNNNRLFLDAYAERAAALMPLTVSNDSSPSSIHTNYYLSKYLLNEAFGADG
jgi:biotin---protein ligase